MVNNHFLSRARPDNLDASWIPVINNVNFSTCIILAMHLL